MAVNPRDGEPPADPASVVRRFHERAREDIAAGGLRPLPSYQALFPGHEAVIAARYDVVRADDPPVEVPSTVDEEVRRLAAETSPPLPLLGEIARGGMGAVLRVRDERLRRDLAMKVLLGDEGRVRGDPTDADRTFIPSPSLRRFLQEAHLTAQLAHPGVPAVHALGVNADGQVYFTMKLVRGRTLAEVFRLQRDGLEGWTLTRTLQALIRVCETMAFAHARGVIHRDLKPPNVMVGRYGEVYVMDWGLARARGQPAGGGDGQAPPPGDRGTAVDGEAPTVPPRPPEPAAPEGDRGSAPGGATPAAGPAPESLTVAGTVLGTPFYMSPEQAAGRHDELDARADVYSLGAMLYELLAGTPPYHNPHAATPHPLVVVAAVRDGPPLPLAKVAPRAPVELVAVVARAMARDPAQRYASAGDLAEDLHRFLDGRTVRAYRTGPLVELRKWIGRNPAVAALLATTVLLLTGGAVAFAVRERDAAEALEQRRVAAEAARDEARAAATRAEGLRLCATSGTVVRDDPSLALLLAVEGAGRAPGAAANDALFAALRDHREVRTFVGHDNYVGGVASTPDGRRLLSREWRSNQCILWDADSGAILARFHGGAPAFTTAEIDATGSRVLTADVDGNAILWDAATGAERLRMAHGGGPLTGAAFVAGGELLLLHGADGRIAMRDAATGAERMVARPHRGGAVLAAAASADASLVVTIGADGAVAAVDGVDGTPRWSLPPTPLPGGESPPPPVVLPAMNGARFVLLRGRRFDLVDATGASVATDGDAAAVAVGGGERRLLLARGPLAARVVELRDAADGAVLATDAVDFGADLLALSPDGDRVVATARGRYLAYAWRPGGYATRDLLLGHTYAVVHVGFLGDGRRAVTGSNDGTVRTWDAVRDEDRLGLVGTGRHVLAQTADGRFAVLHGGPDPDDGGAAAVDLLDTATGATVRALGPHRRPAYACFVDGDRTVGIGDPSGFRLLDIASGRELAAWTPETWPPIANATRALPSPDGNRFLLKVIAGNHGMGFVLERGGGVIPLHRCPADDVAWSPDGTRILRGNGAPRTASVWDVASGREVHRLLGHTAFVMTAGWDPRGRLLVTSANDRTARVWDATSGRLVHRISNLPMRELEVAISDTGVLALHWGTQVDLFRVEDGARIGRIVTTDPVDQSSFDRDGRLWLRERSGRIRAWPVDPGPAARARVRRTLTGSERRLYEVGDPATLDRDERAAARASPRVTDIVREATQLIREGDRTTARELLARAEATRPRHGPTRFAATCLLAADAAAAPAGSAERAAALGAALSALRAATHAGELDPSVLFREPLLEPLRGEEEFAAIVEDLTTVPPRATGTGAAVSLEAALDLASAAAERFPERRGTRLALARALAARAVALAGGIPEREALEARARDAVRAAIDAGAIDPAAAAADPLLGPFAPPR